MAKADEKVMAWVESELEKAPDIEVKDLYEKAKKAHSSVGKLDLRQFNARYPLQVKRKKAGASPARRRRSQQRSRARRQSSVRHGDREAIRGTFLSFATAVTAAADRDDRQELVKVLAGVDQYVDEVMKVRGRK